MMMVMMMANGDGDGGDVVDGYDLTLVNDVVPHVPIFQVPLSSKI